MSGDSDPVGFIGIGSMGEPMALRLARAGRSLVVWNRTDLKCVNLVAAGAVVAKTPRDVLSACRRVILMLATGDAVDSALERADAAAFRQNVADRILINMATPSPSYSKALAEQVDKSGGIYLEAPVSGSRKPAEEGRLVAMLAGALDVAEHVRHLLSPMCRDAVFCGAIPNALNMKLAINLFLSALVAGLAEAGHLAEALGLDLAQFVRVLELSPMSSDVSRVKASKLLAKDFGVQASISNVLQNVALISETAREAGASVPVLDACHSLFREAQAMGLGDQDMIAVVRAVENRSSGPGCT